MEFQRQTDSYDRDKSIEIHVCTLYVHVTTSFSHMQNTDQPYRHSARLKIISISIKTKLKIKYRVSKTDGQL